eukprot:998501-Amphidinium_carterae.2
MRTTGNYFDSLFLGLHTSCFLSQCLADMQGTADDLQQRAQAGPGCCCTAIPWCLHHIPIAQDEAQNLTNRFVPRPHPRASIPDHAQRRSWFGITWNKQIGRQINVSVAPVRLRTKVSWLDLSRGQPGFQIRQLPQHRAVEMSRVPSKRAGAEIVSC